MAHVSMRELLSGHVLTELPHEHEVHLADLAERVNPVLALWPHPVTVTSGYRSMQDHLRIYRSKGIPDNKIPMGSKHLIGCAVDLYDPDLALTHWLKTDPAAITAVETAGLYMEEGNKNWIHFQSIPPKSGHRWFLP